MYESEILVFPQCVHYTNKLFFRMNARLLHSVGAHGRQSPSGESPFRNSLENVDEHTQMIQNDQTKDLETLYLKLENSTYIFFVKPQRQHSKTCSL